MKMFFYSILFFGSMVCQANNNDILSSQIENLIDFTTHGETLMQDVFLVEEGEELNFKGKCFSFGIHPHFEQPDTPWRLRDNVTDYRTNGETWEYLIKQDTDGDYYQEPIEVDVTIIGPAFINILYIPLHFRNTA